MTLKISKFKIKLMGIILIFDALAFGFGSAPIIAARLVLYFLLLLLLPINFSRPRNSTIGIVGAFALFILFISSVNTSSFAVSFDSGLKIALSLVLYICAFVIIKDETDFIKLSCYNFVALIITLCAIGLANIFKFGEINYYDDSILFGATGVNIVKHVFLFGLLSIPYIVKQASKKFRIAAYLAYFFSIIIIFIATKRSALLILIISLILFLYFNRKNLLKISVPILLFVVAGIFFFRDIIYERIDNREGRFDVTNQEEVESEWRVIESLIAIDAFKEYSLLGKLLGEESFNEVQTYNLRYMFHNDFAVLLAGTGLIGLTFYVIILFKTGFWLRKNTKLFLFEHGKMYKWIYLTLFLGLVVFGVSGNFKTLGGTLSLSLTGIGAIQGFIIRKWRN